VAVHSRLVRGLFRRAGLRSFRFFARPLTTGPSALAGFRIRPLQPADFAVLTRDPELDLRDEFIAAAQSRGDFCLGAYEDDRLAGYCWFAFAPLPHLDGVWVRFGSDVSWVYKSFVRPSDRGCGIAPALYRFANQACHERGRNTSLICVESHNAPSVQAALRAGYAEAGRGGYLRRAPVFVQWCSTAVKARGVSFFVPA